MGITSEPTMASEAAQRPTPPASKSADGLVVEYIPGRLYLGSYNKPPTSSTPFPYGATKEKKSSRRSPSKTSNGSSASNTTSKQQQQQQLPPIYFTVDDDFFYNKFFHDFGPFHIGHVYRFAVVLHDFLADNDTQGRSLVLWSKSDPRSRANAACLLTCYMVLVQSWPPHLALAPLAQIEPPLMPYRDSGYSTADFMLTAQDVAYGVWRAREKGLINLREFDLEEYERFERVDQGDFNWVTSDFIAFASPVYPLPPAPDPESDGRPLKFTDEYLESYTPPNGAFPKTVDQVLDDKELTSPFKNVLEHFGNRNVGLVVRLNSYLYPAGYFQNLGMEHIDMIFDDGTCPPLALLRKFIRLAHDTITVQKKKIAVHCKAGLGRTGCFIGAYLIYRYGFSAHEAIAYMRFMRPGMVVGPQQHWLHIHQNDIRSWWSEDRYQEERESLMAQVKYLQNLQTTPSKKNKVSFGNSRTPPSRRSILGEIEKNDFSSQEYSHLPAPTPGQPRKHRFNVTPRNYNRKDENPVFAISRDSDAEGLSEEEINLKLIAKKSTRSPNGEKRRSVSYTLTAAASSKPSKSTTPPSSTRSGTGIKATKVRVSPRKVSGTKDTGVRKVSGRVGSHGHHTTPGKSL